VQRSHEGEHKEDSSTEDCATLRESEGEGESEEQKRAEELLEVRNEDEG